MLAYHRRAAMAVILALVFCQLESLDAKKSREIPKFAFDREDNPMNVPLVINIFLIGFDGLGGSGLLIPADKLEQFMFELFPEHHPSVQDTGEKLHVSFEIWYNVVSIHNSYTEKLYPILSKAMVEAGETVFLKSKDDVVTEYPLFNVAVEGTVEDYFQSVFDEHTKTPRYPTKDSEHRRAYGIFIVNPDKKQLTPNGVAGKPAVYRYKTPGSGSSSAFVSRSRFGVLDLGAGPSQYGHSESAEGTVTDRTFPDPSKFALTGEETEKGMISILQNKFMAQIARPIISAIKTIFAPDVRFDALDYSEKVLVPLVVLRNHLRFDPLEAGHPYSINTSRITETLQSLALPGQEIELVYGLHALSDHENIAIAVERASKTSTTHEPKDGKFRVRSQHYIDSKLLMNDLKYASDYLASGLLSSSKTLQKAFFPDDFNGKTSGSRVLPVFVFSLIDDGEPLLFDRSGLYASSKDMVLVLQNNVDDLLLPYFTQTNSVDISAVDPTQFIVAGIAEALGGLTNPSSSFSSIQKKMTTDFTWSVGFHPFGPFSNSTSLSALHLDLALRNSIISRCDAALNKIRDAMTLLNNFSQYYLLDPWGSELQSKPPPRAAIIQYLYEHQESVGSLGHKVVARLHDDLLSLHSIFEETAEVLYYLNLQKAHTLSDRVFRKASAFHKYVLNELEIADNNLFCCAMDHSVVSRTDWQIFLRCAIGGLFAAAVILLVLGYTPASTAQLARRLNPRRAVKQNIS